MFHLFLSVKSESYVLHIMYGRRGKSCACNCCVHYQLSLKTSDIIYTTETRAENLKAITPSSTACQLHV
ncbi:hypothetical protein TSUD_331360 [Trifolium subterraneum]|uniref:Uncharacterized protein n=1 Tax=Trifolium subterraneum TaxID=3900 RepID=A0A2Z6LYQ0_TRISU|nr:hypothetical protein TSUD_331360 [Trifolium subterraneum]